LFVSQNEISFSNNKELYGKGNANHLSKAFYDGFYSMFQNRKFKELRLLLTELKEKEKTRDCINSWLWILNNNVSLLKQKIHFNSNFEYDFYHPIISEDANSLYISAFNNNIKKQGEDIFIAAKEGSKWSNPEVFSNVNTEQNEVATDLRETDNVLVISRFDKNSAKGDLYTVNTSTFELNSFGKSVNSKDFESDGRFINDSVFIFVSDRIGGIGNYNPKGKYFNNSYWGNTDIYLAFRSKEGWTDVLNIGSSINTPHAERTPYLTTDGQYLFFSSDGYGGFGGLDIYFSRRLKDDSWTEWSVPINIGPAINSPKDEWGFVLRRDSLIAFYSDSKDIYQVDFPNDYFDKQFVYTLSGRIKNSENEYLRADIELINKKDSVSVYRAISDSNGTFSLNLNPLNDYFISVSLQGYLPVSTEFIPALDTLLYSKEFILNREEIIKVDTLDKVITIYFEFNKTDLEKKYIEKLDAIKNILKKHGDSKSVIIEVEGHTDSKGSSKYNKKLSMQRAKTVVEKLFKEGIPKDRFVIRGFGKEYPISKNDTEEGRKKNRRVVIKIYKN